MSKITIPDIASQFASQEALNARFTQVENELNNKVLYRDNPDGEPNAMAQELDMNTNRIINLPEPVAPNDAARLQDVQNSTLDPDTIILTQTEAVTLTAGQLTVVFPTYPTTGASFNVSGPNVDDARLVLGRDFSVPNDTSILLTQSYPAGTLIQSLRNAVGGEEIVDASYSQSETKILADSQTAVTFNTYSTQYAGFYISGTDVDSGRLAPSDYTLISNTSIELNQSYPEGTTVTLLRNSSEAGSQTSVVKALGTVAAMQADTTLVAGESVQTDGYYAVGDGGGANYLIQSSGYTALAGDATLANGNVAELQIKGQALSSWFGTLQDAVDRSDSVLLTKDYTNSSPLSINCTFRDFTLDGGGHKLTSDTGSNISAFGGLLHEQSVTGSTANTITVASGSTIITELTAQLSSHPIIKIVSDDAIDVTEAADKRIGEFARVLSISGGVITLDSDLYFTYTTTPRLFMLSSGKLTVKNIKLDVTDPLTVTNSRAFLTKLNNPTMENIEVIKGGDAGIFLRSCYKPEVLNPTIANLLDDAGGGRYGYGVSDNANYATMLLGGTFSNTRHAYTTNTGTTTVVGDADKYGPTMYSKVSNNTCTENSGDAFDTHSLCFFVEFSNNKTANCLGGSLKDRGKYTKCINQVSDNDEYGIRTFETCDHLTIISPAITNTASMGLFLDTPGTSNVDIDGGVFSKSAGNEVVRLVNCNLTGATTLKYSGATDYAKFIRMESSVANLSNLHIDATGSASANLRIIELTAGGNNVADISHLKVNAISGSNAITAVVDITGLGTNKAFISSASFVDQYAFAIGTLSADSYYKYTYQGGSSDFFSQQITASAEGLPALSYNGSSVISGFFDVTGNKNLRILPDGIFTGQRINIISSKNSAANLTVLNGVTGNTDLISGANVILLPGETMPLYWNGSSWEEFKQSN